MRSPASTRSRRALAAILSLDISRQRTALPLPSPSRPRGALHARMIERDIVAGMIVQA
jgi:hypothetical protein